MPEDTKPADDASKAATTLPKTVGFEMPKLPGASDVTASPTPDKVDASVMPEQSEMDDAEAKKQNLVKMHKFGVVSYVHPTAVAAHMIVGWAVAAY